MAELNDFLTHIDFETVREYCMTNGRTVRYAKGDSFACAGHVGRNAGFVKSGYFTYCTVNETGEYAVTGFSFANDCIVDFTRSFLFDKPSMISIIAGCDAEVMQVPMRVFRSFIEENIPNLIQRMSAVVLEEAYSRYLSHYQKSPTERYLELVDQHPGLLRQITLRELASYLLITPVHLSRIRKKTGR